MNYIVDPSWVYWMNVADAAKWISAIVGGICAIALIIGVPIAIYESCEDRPWHDEVKKWALPCIIASVVLIAIAVFVPSKKTLITMKVAELATKENIDMTAQQLKEIVDYIINAIKELK